MKKYIVICVNHKWGNQTLQFDTKKEAEDFASQCSDFNTYGLYNTIERAEEICAMDIQYGIVRCFIPQSMADTVDIKNLYN